MADTGNGVISNDEFLKHLDMLQATITRLAANSFTLRGWSVTLIAGLFALASKDANPRLVVVGLLPVIAFWWLDSYYVLQERRFRTLFNHVARRDVSVPAFSMNPDNVPHESKELQEAVLRGTCPAFHGTLLLTVLVVSVLLLLTYNSR